MLLITALLILLGTANRPAYTGAPALPSPLVEGQANDPTNLPAEAERRFGPDGRTAMTFLLAHRPERDADLDAEFLLEHVEYALKARRTFAWAKSISDDLFLNDVLPYAILDEPRDQWRRRLFELASDIVMDATTIEEAAQAINRELFRRTGVSYSTQRLRPNQSALECMELGISSCTGLSIMYVSACRAVGIPARVAGIHTWVHQPGNHTWAEVWDGERWRFTGAAEYDAGGLDRAWFIGGAAQAIEGHERHAIWASSWKPTGRHFPLAWNRGYTGVPGVDVTARYARAGKADPDVAALRVRLWTSRSGTRLAADVRAVACGGANDGENESNTARTFADPDDINRTAELSTSPPLRLEVTVGDETRTMWLIAAPEQRTITELYWDELSLSRQSAEAAVKAQWEKRDEALRTDREGELEAKAFELEGHRMRFDTRIFGDEPASGRSLWISMHGGGGAPEEVNDRQWANQIRLYEPAEGIYLAPRAPANTWDLWHRAEVDRLFERLIETAVAAWNVDPDRVYLMGYSAGGDGVYQLAPRMADRFAAASMMAGHPNNATPHGLRNLPFAIFMGGDDSAYNRNTVAAQWGEQLGALRSEDPEGYEHRVTIYPETGHWMGGRDREALPWMAGFTRDPWPARIVWRQGNVPHQRFYWLRVAAEHALPGRVIIAEVSGQEITITSADVPHMDVLLHDDLLDLDQPVRIVLNGETVFEGRVHRSESVIRQSLAERGDPRMAATAVVRIGG